MGNVLWFVLFLFAYGLFSVVSSRQTKNLMRTRRWFWPTELAALTSSVALFVFLYTLARSRSTLIPAGLFLATQVSVLLRAASSMTTVGESPGQLLAESRWTSVSMMIRHRWVAIVSGLLLIIVGLGYPVAAGIVYFSNTVPSPAATLSVTRITLLVLFVGGTLGLLTSQIGLFTSENLNAASRQKLFYPTLGGLVPNGFILAVLLWTFSAPSAAAHSSQGIHVRFTPLVLVILLGYFLGTAVVPFIVGSSRNRKWQNQLRARQPKALGDVIQILNKPVSDSYDDELSALVSKLEKERADFVASDEGISYGLWLDQQKVTEAQLSAAAPGSASAGAEEEAVEGAANVSVDGIVGVEAVLYAPDTASLPEVLQAPTFYDASVVQLVEQFDPQDFYTSRSQDPRFEYVDWLDELIGEVGETRRNLAEKRGGASRVKTAKDWADSYDNQRDELKETEPIGKSAVGAMVVGTLFTSLLGVVFTGFGNVLWTHASSAVPK